MSDELGVIWLLAIGLGLAALFGVIAQRLKLSPIIGYLLAGYLLGPNFPGFMVDPYIADQLASIGITLLMFAVGLHFHWQDLIAVQKIAVPGALFHAFVSIAAGAIYSVYLGETWLAGLITGLAICVSSTVVLVRVLADQGLFHTKQGHIVVGWTIVEDLISIFGLLILPSIVPAVLSASTPLWGVISQIPWITFKIFSLGLFVYFLGDRLISFILKKISKTKSHELFTLSILAIAFLIALGSSYLFGVSIVLGAFIAGTIVGKTEVSHQAAADAIPMRDTFAVIFFLSVGMLFNPLAVMKNLPLFFGILAIVLFVRPIVAFLIVKLAKYQTNIAFTVGLAIAQIGEYSFIVAEEGSRLGVLSDSVFDILVASSFISIAMNPMLFKLFEPYLKKYVKPPLEEPEPHFANLDSTRKDSLFSLPKAIVVGYGLVGKGVARYLLKKGYRVTVIDRNSESSLSTKERGLDILSGDAANFEILKSAQIEKAKLLVITIPEFSIAEPIIQVAKVMNPSLQIIARSCFQAGVMDKASENVLTVCDEEAASEKCIALINEQLDA